MTIDEIYEDRRRKLIEIRGGDSVGDLTNDGFRKWLTRDLGRAEEQIAYAVNRNKEKIVQLTTALLKEKTKLETAIRERKSQKDINSLSEDKKLAEETLAIWEEKLGKEGETPIRYLRDDQPTLCEFCPAALWRGSAHRIQMHCLQSGTILIDSNPGKDQPIIRFILSDCYGFEQELLDAALAYAPKPPVEAR